MDIKDFYKALVIDGGEENPINAYLLRFSGEGESEAILHLDTEIHPGLEMESRILERQQVELRILFGSRGIECYEGTVSYVLKERLHVKNIKFLNRIQRRNDVKAPMIYEGKIVWLPDKDKENDEKSSVQEEIEIDVIFRDISSGGVGFRIPSESEAHEYLKLGRCYEMMFDKCKTPFYILFRLIRISEGSDGYLNCGGRFISVNVSQEVMIRQYVFRVESGERERLKKILAVTQGMREEDMDEDMLGVQKESESSNGDKKEHKINLFKIPKRKKIQS